MSEVVKWHMTFHQTKTKVEDNLELDLIDPLPQSSIETKTSSHSSVEYADGSFAAVHCFGPFRSIEAKVNELLDV